MVELVDLAAVAVVPLKLEFVVLQLVDQLQMELDFHLNYWAAMLPDLDLPDLDLRRSLGSSLQADLQLVDDELVVELGLNNIKNVLLQLFLEHE